MRRFMAMLLLLSGASTAYGEIYTWRDARGTLFYTNSLHEIPARYLKKARVLDVATGKKAGLATEQPAAPSATAASPGQAPAANPVATPLPPVSAPPTPESARPAPSSLPPAAAVARPQLPSREARGQGMQRRRGRPQPEEE